QSAEDVLDLAAVVPDDTLGDDVDAEQVELGGDEQRVGVVADGRQQLAADRDDRRASERLHASHPAGVNAMRPRITRLPYTAAMPSSAMTPSPPGSFSKPADGHGLTTSSTRNTRKA